MMRWALLIVCVCAFASLWGVGPEFGLIGAFAVAFANFATFCLLYDRPMNQARLRMADSLHHAHSDTDAAQRMATATITPIAADYRLGFGPMTLLNLATGIAGGGLLIWGIALRVF